jgi:pilus assembly protein CpaC
MNDVIKVFLLIISFMLSSVMTEAVAASSTNEIELFSGQAQVLPIAVTRIAVGNGKIISVSIVSQNQLLILAETPGVSTLHLWMKDGSQKEMTVFVLEANMKKFWMTLIACSLMSKMSKQDSRFQDC